VLREMTDDIVRMDYVRYEKVSSEEQLGPAGQR
jgi:hypothetical protein